MIETFYNQDVNKPVKVQYLDGNVFSLDNNGNKIGVNLYDGTSPVDVAGTISANVIRADGATVAVSGSSSNNSAWVVLPQTAYAVPGLISVIIKATSGSNITTLCAVVGNVYQSSTDSTVDPGTIIPSISTLIAAIDSAVASIPADYTSLWTTIAPAFSTSETYAAGDYVTYEGHLYRAQYGYTGSWTTNVFTQVDATNDAYDIARTRDDWTNAGLSRLTGNNVYTAWIENQWIDTSSTVDITTTARHISANCIVVPCVAGDVFTLTGTGYTTAHRLYAFIDSNGTKLLYAGSSATVSDQVLIAPTDSAYLVVNVDYSKPYYLVKGEYINSRYNALKAEADLTKAISDKTLYVVEWEQGSVNNSTGKKNSSTYSIRTRTFNLGSFISASSANPIKLQAACYDATNAWLGKTGAVYTLDSAYILTAYATTKYIKVIAYNTNEDPLTPSAADSSGITCFISDYALENNDTKLPTLTDIQARFNDNGVLSENVSFGFVTDSNRSIVVQFNAQYTGTDKPYFLYRVYTADGTLLMTGQRYYFYGADEPIKQAFRVPNGYPIASISLQINIPTGSTLAVTGFDCYYEESVRKGTGNVSFHAHRGFDAMYPDGSYNAYVAAAELGFQSCIAIPKFTSDGVPVEFHDDNTISGQMTQMDGTPIPSQYDVSIGQLTYSQLMQWSIGYSKNPVFASAKILKLADLFRICAETGMRPVFSIHSADAPTPSEWLTLKGMLDKYRLIPQMSVKTGDVATWTKVINAFGNGTFHSLIWLYSSTSTYDVLQRIAENVQTAGVDVTKTKIDVEFFQSSLESSTYGATQTAQLQAAVAAGYTVSVVLDGTSTSDTLRTYMDMGVSEFTNKRHTSIGLNW